jgi:Fe-S cluster assembly iron-binding protein IscA
MPGTKSEPLLQITDGALREVAGLAARGNGGRLALWIEITGVGADDFSYNLSLRPLAEAGTEDLVEEHGEVLVVVPAANIDQLRGATVDLVGDLSTGGLIVENPNTPSPAVSDFPELDLAGTVEERVSHQSLDCAPWGPSRPRRGPGKDGLSADERRLPGLRARGGHAQTRYRGGDQAVGPGDRRRRRRYRPCCRIETVLRHGVGVNRTLPVWPGDRRKGARCTRL